jgi:hypothetical protein
MDAVPVSSKRGRRKKDNDDINRDEWASFHSAATYGVRKEPDSIRRNEDKYGSPPHSIEIYSIITLSSQLKSLSVHSIT